MSPKEIHQKRRRKLRDKFSRYICSKSLRTISWKNYLAEEAAIMKKKDEYHKMDFTGIFISDVKWLIVSVGERLLSLLSHLMVLAHWLGSVVMIVLICAFVAVQFC